MNGPLCRLTAVSCLVVATMVHGVARAESIPVTVPVVEYPELEEKPADPTLGEALDPSHVSDDGSGPIYYTLNGSSAEMLASSTGATTGNTMPVKVGNEWVWTYNGVEYRCTCTTTAGPGDPTGTPTGGPTPAQSMPEPSTLLLFGLGSVGLALARRRR